MNIEDRSERRSPGSPLDPKQIAFGKTFAPNMFVCDYKSGRWQDARLEPVHNFSLHPAALVFHYAQAIFEGLKAFRQVDDSIALFRPEKNAARFNRSAARMCMPELPEELFLTAITELTRVEEDYVLAEPGSLYLRPTMIGTEACIGVRSSSEFLFYILALPSGAYFPEAHGGPGAVHVLISKSVVRATRGGTGAVKAAANYAVTLKTISDAKQNNCAQVLFLDASQEQRVEEMGGMNIMFVEGGALVTPPLNDTI
ncbi:MAG TPA: aminotransferase class IV, partial [Bryobacteraceae bacterium]|nr:aminotransferase class IV [Bryobacteraceae bacterium]